MGQIWFQNQSIEFEVARLDRFCCPHSSDDCSSKSLRRAFVTPCHTYFGDYMRLPIII